MMNEEIQMESAEQLILKADAILAQRGYVIEAHDYQSYADTLDGFVMSSEGEFSIAEAGILSKVGDVVRKAAHAYGAVKGGIAGAKTRWSNFKSSVKGAFHAGHKKAFDKTSGGASSGGGDAAAGRAAHAAKGAAAEKAGKGKSKGRGGKMSDDEYKKRYGSKKRIASSVDMPVGDFETLMDSVQSDFFERIFNGLDKKGLLALESLMAEEGNPDGQMKILLAQGVDDPFALVSWLQSQNEAAVEAPVRRTPSAAAAAVLKLSGATTPMQSWVVPSSK